MKASDAAELERLIEGAKAAAGRAAGRRISEEGLWYTSQLTIAQQERVGEIQAEEFAKRHGQIGHWQRKLDRLRANLALRRTPRPARARSTF